MAGSNGEIKAVRKRLAELEQAIGELKKGDLTIAQNMGRLWASIEYNVALHFFAGEEHETYSKLWLKRLDAAKEEIEASQTVGGVFGIVYKFEADWLDYIKAEKVKTAEQATEIAHTFIKKYSTVALPMRTTKEGDVWIVDIDVGAIATKIAKVKVDARTGDVLGHEIPEK